MFPVQQYGRSIHQDMTHAGRVLVGAFEGGVILDGIGIEDGHIREKAGLESATPIQPERFGR